MNPRVFKPGWQSWLLLLFLILFFGGLLVGMAVTDPTGKNLPVVYLFGGIMAPIFLLIACNFLTLQLTLEDEGMIYRTLFKTVRIRWDQVKDVSGTVTDGRHSRELVVLDVPGLEGISGGKGGWNQKDQLRIPTTNFSVGTGEIVAAIRQRAGLDGPPNPTPVAAARTSGPRLRQGESKAYFPWMGLLGIAMFGGFAAIGTSMFFQTTPNHTGTVLGLLFDAFFIPLSVVFLVVTCTTKLRISEKGIISTSPGLQVSVPWSDIVGTQLVGNDYRSSNAVVIVNLRDFHSFTNGLSESQRRKVLNMLAGRGEGLPIQPAPFLAKPSGVQDAISSWME